MRSRRGRAMQLLGITRAPRDPALGRCGCGARSRIGRRRRVTGRETKPANKNRKPEIRGLAKLPVEQGKKAGAVKHQRQNFAALQLSQTENSELEGENGAPQKISDAEDGPAFQDHAAPFAFGQKKDRAAGKNLRAAVAADTRPRTADRRAAKKKESFRESTESPRDQTAGDGGFLRFGDGSKSIGENFHPFIENGQPRGDQQNNDDDKEIASELIHRSGANGDDEKERREYNEDGEQHGAAPGNANRNDKRESAGKEKPVAGDAAGQRAIKQISRRHRPVEDYSGNKREGSRWPDLSAAGGDLLRFAQGSSAIDKRFGIGIELHRKKQAHRQKTDQHPPAEFLDVFGVKRAADHENQREMEEIAAKPETGDEDQRFERQIRFEHEQRHEPGKQTYDAQCWNPGGPRKDSGLDREHINHDDNGIADDKEQIGKLREQPFAKNALENKQEKIDPDRPLDVGEKPLVSRRLHGEFGNRRRPMSV